MTTDDELLTLAVHAARQAGSSLAARFREGRIGERRYKSPRSLVTEADTEAEAIITGHIRQCFPDHAILAEEGSEGARDSKAPFTWIVDPLDGTTNFARGIPHFAVSIGVVDHRSTRTSTGNVCVGVIFDPILDELFTATADNVATCNGTPIRVSETAAMDLSILATGFPLREPFSLSPKPMLVFQRAQKACEDIRRLASATLDFAYVATGRLDGYWEEHLSPWDVAAGMLIVERAGGRVSPIREGEEILATGSVVATNAALHDELVALTRS